MDFMEILGSRSGETTLHSEMMGCSAGSGTTANACDFMHGYRSCFVASEKDGFDMQRCVAAKSYLEAQGAGAAPSANH